MRHPMDYHLPPRTNLLLSGVALLLYVGMGILLYTDVVVATQTFVVYPIGALLMFSEDAVGTLLWVRDARRTLDDGLLRTAVQTFQGETTDVTRFQLLQAGTFGLVFAGLGAGVAAALNIAPTTHSIITLLAMIPWFATAAAYLALEGGVFQSA